MSLMKTVLAAGVALAALSGAASAQFAVMFLMVFFPQLVTVPARWFY